MKSKNIKVAMGLSGGVDSAISLLLLKEQGYEPVGVFLKCFGKENFTLAQKLCRQTKTPYHIIDVRDKFRKKVIDYFLSALKNKKTPNPCIVCNYLVKFKELLWFAQKKGIKYIATGHYAGIRENKGEYCLLKGKDKKKDQSYFLCLLNQAQLKRIIFPLGNYTKKEIYQLAKKRNLNSFIKKKQSQDLCFTLPKMISNPGQIIDKKGSILGKHKGLYLYTIGQRKGINLPNGPWWVSGFNKKKNQLIVTNKENDPSLFSKTVIISEPNFISRQVSQKTIRVKAKTRFNQILTPAILYVRKNNTFELVFDKPQKAVAPGQYAVFYLGDVCLGGGVIE